MSLGQRLLARWRAAQDVIWAYRKWGEETLVLRRLARMPHVTEHILDATPDDEPTSRWLAAAHRAADDDAADDATSAALLDEESSMELSAGEREALERLFDAAVEYEQAANAGELPEFDEGEATWMMSVEGTLMYEDGRELEAALEAVDETIAKAPEHLQDIWFDNSGSWFYPQDSSLEVFLEVEAPRPFCELLERWLRELAEAAIDGELEVDHDGLDDIVYLVASG